MWKNLKRATFYGIVSINRLKPFKTFFSVSATIVSINRFLSVDHRSSISFLEIVPALQVSLNHFAENVSPLNFAEEQICISDKPVAALQLSAYQFTFLHVEKHLNMSIVAFGSSNCNLDRQEVPSVAYPYDISRSLNYVFSKKRAELFHWMS